jgi:chorismate--pyruvate lyase
LYAVHPSIYQPEESIWQDYHHFTAAQLPSSIRHWILDSSSLTQRLIKVSGGNFKVQVVSQQWQRPRQSERQLLQMENRELAIVREVILRCHDQPWVFARSVIPATSISGHLRQLRKFKSNSLGTMLFNDPSMRRSTFQLATIDGLSQQLPIALQQPQPLWGRRCRFELIDKPIMVSEIFLPTFQPEPSITTSY